MEYSGGVPEWPYNGFVGQYDDESWQYARHASRRSGQGRVDRAVRRGAGDHVRHESPTGGGQACGPSLRRAGQVAAEAAAAARRDAAGSALRLPDRQAALQPLHAGDGRADDRLPARHVPQSGRDDPRQLRRRPHHLVRVRRGVDAAHQRPADHRLLRAAPAAAREHRPARAPASWRSAATPRSRARPTCRRSTTRSTATCPHPTALKKHDTLRDYLDGRDRADGLLGQHAEVHGLVPQVHVRRRGDAARTTSATAGIRRSSATTRTCRCSWR